MSIDSTPPAPDSYSPPSGPPAVPTWDGQRWVPPTSQPTPQQTTAGAIGGLAMASPILLALCALMGIVSIATEVYGIIAVTNVANGEASAIRRLDSYESTNAIVTIVAGLVTLASGIVWMVWQFRVAQRVRNHVRRRPSWHVLSWCIPVINYWFPYQNVSDIWRAVGRPRTWMMPAWWTLWICGSILSNVSGRVYAYSTTLDGSLAALWMSVVGESLTLAAVPLAILLVRRITQSVIAYAASL